MSLPRPVGFDSLLKSVSLLVDELERQKLLSAIEGVSKQPLVKLGRKTANTDGGGNITVTYATPFPTATDYVFAVAVNASTNPVYRIGSWTAAQFVAFFNVPATAEDFFWLAIGH